MLVLLDNGQDLEDCAKEIGCPVGQLLTPLTRYRLRTDKFAIDNGGFKRLDIPAFEALLAREEANKEKCLFVASPDVLCSARRTGEVFQFWKPKLNGWKIAFVCQDGQEDLPMPWAEIDAIFIGGSTEWKCGPHAKHLIVAAQAQGKWVHAGRVNGPERFKYFEDLGVDSCDGTGLARYTHMRKAIANRHNQGDFLNEVA
jgi:hypothetical protein